MWTVWEAKFGELSVLLGIGKTYKSAKFRVFWISWEIVSKWTKDESFLVLKASG